jgi:hypothetical protein
MTEQLGLAGVHDVEPSLWRRDVGQYCYSTAKSWTAGAARLGWIVESASEALEKTSALAITTRGAGFEAYETWHVANLLPCHDFSSASRGEPESLEAFALRCTGLVIAFGTQIPRALRHELCLDIVTVREALRIRGKPCTLYSLGSSEIFPGPDARRRLIPFSTD